MASDFCKKMHEHSRDHSKELHILPNLKKSVFIIYIYMRDKFEA